MPKTQTPETDPFTLPGLHDDFMTESALLNMSEEGSETHDRHSRNIDFILQEAVKAEPDYAWQEPAGYIINLLMDNVEYRHKGYLFKPKKGLWS